MNPEIINDGQPAKHKRCGGGRAFHSRLESFVDFIREQRQQRRTWQEIATLLRTEKGCVITFQGLHQFYRRYLKRQARPHWEERRGDGAAGHGEATQAKADASNNSNRNQTNEPISVQHRYMKTTKHRLILPMQAKGNMGKSIEAAARACWLNQRGIPWQGFDLDGDNRTLSRLFPSQVKLTPLNGQAEDLDELISILRKTTAKPVTLIDPRAHLDAQLMKALAATHFFDIASAQNIGITLMVFPVR